MPDSATSAKGSGLIKEEWANESYI